MKPLLLITKIPNKVVAALPHPSIKGQVVLRSETTIQVINAIDKTPVGSAQLPNEKIYFMKYIGEILHLVTECQILTFDASLKGKTVVASTKELFKDAKQVIVSAFGGCVRNQTYLLSAVVVTSAGQQLRTLLCAGGKAQVVPDIVSSGVLLPTRRSFSQTSLGLMADFKQKTVKSADLLSVSDKAAAFEPKLLQLNDDEIAKYLISNNKLGLVAVFTSTNRLIIADGVNLKVLIELKTQSPVVAAAAGDNGFLYVQADGRVFEAQIDVDILFSTAAAKLDPAELYSFAFSSQFFGNAGSYFAKAAKPYLDGCISAKKFADVAEIVADALHYQNKEFRGQQLIDKISLSGDKAAFKVYAGTLVQKRQVKLTLDEQVAVIKQLHQEQQIAAFLKFFENDFCEYEPNNEVIGNLFIELAGVPVGKEYSSLALMAFQKNGCHLRVLTFYLKNGGIEVALKYLKQSGVSVDFDFIAYLQQQYGSLGILKGDQKYNCQQEAQKLLQSEALNAQTKEKLIMEVCAPLDMSQAVIQYLNTELKTHNTPEMQTLFVKFLIFTAGDNLPKIKQNLLSVLPSGSQLDKADKEQIALFAIKNNHHDIALVLGLMCGKIFQGQKLHFSNLEFIQFSIEKINLKNAANEEFVKELVSLLELEASDKQVMTMFMLITTCYSTEPAQLRDIAKVDERLYLEVFRKFAYTNFQSELDDLFKLMFKLIVLKKPDESSGRTSLKGIYEHIIRANMDFDKIVELSHPIIDGILDNDILKQYAHVALFPFIVFVMKKQDADYLSLISQQVPKLSETVPFEIIIDVLLDKYGYPQAGQTQDKFSHIGQFEIMCALVRYCIDQNKFEDCQTILSQVVKHINVIQTFSLFEELINNLNNLEDKIACIQIIISTTIHDQVQHTLQLEQNIFKALSQQIIGSEVVQQNMLDQVQLLKNLKQVQPYVLEQTDNIIAPMLRILDAIALLQITEANDLFVDYAVKTLKIQKSDTIIRKIIDICVVKQEQQLWIQLSSKIPTIIDDILRLSVQLSGQPALTFAVSIINADNVDFKIVKEILKESFKSGDVDKQFAQNIMLQISIKIGDEDQFLLDIKANEGAVTTSVATLAQQNKMFLAGAMIYKVLKLHVDAINCLLENSLVDKAHEFCEEMKSAQAWRVLCNYWIQHDQLQKAYDALIQTNELTLSCDLAREVFKSGPVQLVFDLSQYMLNLRKDQNDKFIDNDLALLLAVCMNNTETEFDANIKEQLAQLLCDPQTTCNPQKLGDSCFIKELFQPARLFFLRAGNFIAVNAVCLKIHDYLGALKASINQNTRDIWYTLRAELIQLFIDEYGEVDQTKLIYLIICSLNLFSSNQDIVEFMQINCHQLKLTALKVASDLLFASQRSEFAGKNIEQINTELARLTKDLLEDFEAEKTANFENVKKLVINSIHPQLLNVFGAILAKEGCDQLLPYLKKFHKLLDLQFINQQCEKLAGLGECQVFCQVAQGNIDASVNTIINTDGDVTQLLKLLPATSQLETHAKALKFIIERRPEVLPQHLPIALKVLSPAQIAQMTQIAANGMEALFEPFFVTFVINAASPIDDAAANAALIKYLRANEKVHELQVLVSKVNQFERQLLADELAELPLFHHAAATIYNKIGQAPKAVQILLNDGLIIQAVDEIRKSQNKEAAQLLLAHIFENSEDEIVLSGLEAAGHLVRLDVLMGLCHKFGKFDLAMSHLILSVGRLVDKVECVK